MSTLQKLKDYEKALADWKRREGKSGGGGEYNHKEHKYENALEPKPPSDAPKNFCKQIRAKILG